MHEIIQRGRMKGGYKSRQKLNQAPERGMPETVQKFKRKGRYKVKSQR